MSKFKKSFEKFQKIPQSLQIAIALGVFVSILIMIGTADLDYSYYKFLRFTVFLSMLFSLYMYYLNKEVIISFPTVSYFLTIVLFNPVLPIEMEKETWVGFDVIFSVLVFSVTVFVAYKELKIVDSNVDKEKNDKNIDEDPNNQ